MKQICHTLPYIIHTDVMGLFNDTNDGQVLEAILLTELHICINRRRKLTLCLSFLHFGVTVSCDENVANIRQEHSFVSNH